MPRSSIERLELSAGPIPDGRYERRPRRQFNVYRYRPTDHSRAEIARSDVSEVPDDCPVLIGQIPLESLDFVVDLTEVN